MPRHNACDDFHRTSEAKRRDFLGAPRSPAARCSPADSARA